MGDRHSWFPEFNDTGGHSEWHRIHVHGELRFKDKGIVLRLIKKALDQHFRAVVYKKNYSNNDVSFYIRDGAVAEKIANLNLDGSTFEVFFSVEPAFTTPTPGFCEKIDSTLKTHFTSDGTLNLSSFVLFNKLSLEHYLPLNNFKIRSIIDKLIMNWTELDQITKVDLSNNDLRSFEGFQFLTAAKNIQVLIANQNPFRSLNVLDRLKSLQLRELSLMNNHIGIQFNKGGRDRHAYIDDCRELFPYLQVLDNDPIKPRKRLAPDNNDGDNASTPSPLKFPRRLQRKRPFRRAPPMRGPQRERERRFDTPPDTNYSGDEELLNNISNNNNQNESEEDNMKFVITNNTTIKTETVTSERVESEKNVGSSLDKQNNSTPIQYSENDEKLAIRLSRMEKELKDANMKILKMSQLVDNLCQRQQNSESKIQDLQKENDYFRTEITKICDDVYSDTEAGDEQVTNVEGGNDGTSTYSYTPSVETMSVNTSSVYEDMEDLFERPNRTQNHSSSSSVDTMEINQIETITSIN